LLNGCGIKTRKIYSKQPEPLHPDYHLIHEETLDCIDRYLYLAKTDDKTIDSQCTKFQKKKFSSSQDIKDSYRQAFKKLINHQINKKGDKFMMSSIKEVATYELPISHETLDNQTHVYIEALDFQLLQSLTDNDIDLVAQAMLNHVLDYLEHNAIAADVLHIMAEHPLAFNLLEAVEAAIESLKDSE
jgi:hypothetical protein